MIRIVDQNTLNSYLENDWVAQSLHCLDEADIVLFTTDKWLLNSPAKRCIFDLLYGDLIHSEKRIRVLDVGGGLSSFAWSKFSKIDYEVLDLFHHESSESLNSFHTVHPRAKLIREDWYGFEITQNYDVVIANDLFPNVDQRVDEFIEKFSQHTSEIRLSLTYYNQRRCYKVKRVDADEVFFIRPWNGQQLGAVLTPFIEDLNKLTPEKLTGSTESIFENGRQVCTVAVRG
jgi:hypothetical protein